jgi:hypothetical protein
MLIPWLLACSATQLSQAYQIDRLRVLAVAAEPAEPQPGQLVTFSGLVVSPDPVGGSVWFTCSAASSDDYGCSIDESLLESAQSGEATIEDLQAAGFLGFLPDLPPFWVVPADYLDKLDDEAKLEGTFAMIYITAFPEVAEGDTAETAAIDEDEVEIAYKRVPVSLAPTPNQNPVVTALTIDGVAVPAGARWKVDPGQTYEIGVELSETSIETYTYRNSDDKDEERIEEPYFSWYLQQGEFDQESVLWPHTSVLWTAPSSPDATEESLWVVVRDRRGGMAWGSLSVYY